MGGALEEPRLPPFGGNHGAAPRRRLRGSSSQVNGITSRGRCEIEDHSSSEDAEYCSREDAIDAVGRLYSKSQ